MRVVTVRDMGNAVRDRRAALGLTQAEVARRAGVSRLWVNQVEGGHSGASTAKMLDLFEALGLALELVPADRSEDSRQGSAKRSPLGGGRVRRAATKATKVSMPAPKRLSDAT